MHRAEDNDYFRLGPRLGHGPDRLAGDGSATNPSRVRNNRAKQWSAALFDYRRTHEMFSLLSAFAGIRGVKHSRDGRPPNRTGVWLGHSMLFIINVVSNSQ